MCLFTTVHSVKMLMLVSALNSKLFYTSAKFSEHQTYMIRDKCFDCDQKEHTQKSCLMHSFEKICLLLNFKMNWFMNSVSQTDVKFIMKLTVKSVTNMNMCINLSENTQTVFTKKICIVLSVISQIMSLNESENESFWDQVTFQNTIKKNLWCVYAFWASTRTTEVTHLSTWLTKYDFKKNELRHKFW